MAITDESTASSAETTHVVVLVHGIRTVAEWQNAVRGELEKNGFTVVPVRYGYLGLSEFLFPIARLRNRSVQRVLTQVRDARMRYEKSALSFIAHSFGTFVVLKILEDNPDIRAHRIIFCGSVVAEDFRFDRIAASFTPDLLNECGTRDYWPVMAASVTWGYGAAGAFGLAGARVRDRWHNRKGHSAFLTADFCRKNWVPFLRDGTVVRSDGDRKREPTPALIKFLNAIKLRRILYVILLVVAVLVTRSLFFYRDSVDYRIPAAGGVGYLNETISSIISEIREPCRQNWMPDWMPDRAVQWLSGRRCVSIEEVTSDIRSVIVCAPFECRSCTPFEALIKLKDTFGACVRVEGVGERRLRISTNRLNTSEWRDASGATWRLCACSEEAIKVLESRHGKVPRD